MTGRHARALGVANRGIDGKRSCLHALRDLDRLMGLYGPGMEEVQIMMTGEERVGIRQAREGVLTRESRDLPGGTDRTCDRSTRKVAGAGMPPACAQVNGDTQPLVSGLLDGLDAALSHIDRQTRTLTHIDCGGTGTQRFGLLQDILGEVLELGTGVIKHGGSAFRVLEAVIDRGRRQPCDGLFRGFGLS
jgi:hypothetical protein